MPKYLVEIPEVHYSVREVEATNPIEALDAAGDLGDEVAVEYSHTLDKEFWRVSKKEDN
jgi:hypothetical protein